MCKQHFEFSFEYLPTTLPALLQSAGLFHPEVAAAQPHTASADSQWHFRMMICTRRSALWLRTPASSYRRDQVRLHLRNLECAQLHHHMGNRKAADSHSYKKQIHLLP